MVFCLWKSHSSHNPHSILPYSSTQKEGKSFLCPQTQTYTKIALLLFMYTAGFCLCMCVLLLLFSVILRMGLPMYSRLTSNARSACLNLPNVGIIGLNHQAWCLELGFQILGFIPGTKHSSPLWHLRTQGLTF
jgi:hypothetical protein